MTNHDPNNLIAMFWNGCSGCRERVARFGRQKREGRGAFPGQPKPDLRSRSSVGAMAETTKPPQISPDGKWWWDGGLWRPIVSPIFVLVMRALDKAVIGMLCWALLPVGIAAVMTLVTPTYWRPMFSLGGLILLAVGVAAIGISVALAAVARRFARPTRGALLAGLGIVMVAILVQFVALWVVLLGPALLILLNPVQT